jgi:hypothetical protein
LTETTATRNLPCSTFNQSTVKPIFVVAFAKSDTRLEAAACKDESKLSGGFTADSLLRESGIQPYKNKGILIDEKRTSPSLFYILGIFEGLIVPPEISIKVNEERISIIKQLSGLGYRIAVADYGFTDQNVLDRVRPCVKFFAAKPPIIGQINQTKELSSSSSWTRDLWTNLDGKRVRRFTKDFSNPVGEGGMIVTFGERCALISEDLKENFLIRKLSSSGYSFYFLNDGVQFKPNLSRILGVDAYMFVNHPDLFAGIVGNVIVVDPNYYNRNRFTFKRLLKEKKLKDVFVPIEESKFYPANFLPTGENEAIVERRAVKTISLLRQNGVNVIPTDVDLEANIYSGGGIRCFVNTL